MYDFTGNSASRRAARLILVLLSVTLTQQIGAGSLPLRWDRAPGAFEYRVYFGAQMGAYDEMRTVRNRTQLVLDGLTDCTTWYAAVRSRNAAGESAGFSNEVVGWPGPRVDSWTPGSVTQGGRFSLDLFGANFQALTRVELETDPYPTDLLGNPLIRIESVTPITCRQLRLELVVEPLRRGHRAMPVGAFLFRFNVTNPDARFRSGTDTLEIEFDFSRWDINRGDGSTLDRIDGSDLSWLAFAYGASEGHPRYEPDADLNGDGLVDGTDLAFLAAGFGRCWRDGEWSIEACEAT